MSTAHVSERGLIEQAEAEGLLPPEAGASWHAAAGPSWVITALSFIGAQLVVLPFLVFLELLSNGFFFEPPGAFIAAVALIAGATWLLRQQPAMFVTQLAFSALVAGLALVVVGFEGVLHNPQLLTLLLVLLAVAMLIEVAWVQRVLGFLAALVALMVLLWPVDPAAARNDWLLGAARLLSFPAVLNAVLLALLWALWVVRERRWSGRPWAPALHALADGACVALLLSVVYGSTRHFWLLGMLSGGPAGSADVAGAGQARIFDPGWPALLQMVLVLGAAWWLGRHWRLRELPAREQALLALVPAVLLFGCLVVPHIGVVALLGALALGSGRRLMAGLTLAALLAQLSGFYYALDWPLTHKAALLAGLGAALGLALWLLRAPVAGGQPTPPTEAAAGPRWLAPALIAAGAVLSLGLVHVDVQTKEQVIAHGEKIYLPLAPRDPRSLMQGDYMALNFAVPGPVREALGEQRRQAQVVATLDARGVATVQRLARAGEPLTANERLLPLKRLKGDWVLVTDAFYFPEGQGAPFAEARFGEFRALPDGRALLVGLADENLRPIAPAPRGGRE